MTSPGDVPPLHVRVMGITIAIDPEDQPTRDRLAHPWDRAITSHADEPTGRRVPAPAGPGEEGTHGHA